MKVKTLSRTVLMILMAVLWGLSLFDPDGLTALAATATPTPDNRAPIFTYKGPEDPVLPLVVSARARQIYQAGLEQGNDPRAFAKVGDCNSRIPLFLAPFDGQQYRLGPRYAYLQATIDRFADSFQRDSVSARDGFSTSSVFAPLQADPSQCFADEAPVVCEFRLTRPSLVFISLGTNGADWQTDESYERGMRKIIEYAIEHGALPILSTKADDLEGDARFNFIVQKLAREYELPLWNFWKAARDLPSFGLERSYHLEWEKPVFDTPGAPLTGWQMRNLTALQSLDGVWRAVTHQPIISPAPWPASTPTLQAPRPTPTVRPPAKRHRWLEE